MSAARLNSTAIRKSWRDSACLMLVNGPFKYTKQPLPRTVTWSTTSVPICLGEVAEGEGKEMELLFVQRNKRSGFYVRSESGHS